MDGHVKLATNDGERWAYVADALKETAEQNKATAVILARISEQLDDHERQITELRAGQQKAVEREIERASSDAPAESAAAMATSSTPRTVAEVLNRVYSDWRIVGAVCVLVGTLLGSHFGITWHW